MYTEARVQELPFEPQPTIEPVTQGPDLEQALSKLGADTDFVVANINGNPLRVTVNSDGVFEVKHEGDASVQGACAYAVTSAVFALGAVALGALAASSNVGVVIAGVFIRKAILQALSSASGAWAALYAIIAAYVCK